MRIIPAIDIIDGKCVRLTQGDYAQQKVYNENPLEVAKAFEDHGLEYLHLVDLDGARSQQIVNYRVLERIATKTRLRIDFGGGIKRDEDVRIALASGAAQITGGSIAAKDPTRFESWIRQFGPEVVILGADCRDRKIAVQGWAESTELDVVDYILDYQKKGVQYVVCTDIARDGMLEGAAVDLYQEISEKAAVRLIASGGVSSLDDLHRLAEAGCEGAIVGKAIYEQRISLSALSQIK